MKRCPGQRGEGLAAAFAPKSLRSKLDAMLDHRRARAVRAAWTLRQARHHQALYAVRVLPLPQGLQQCFELRVREPFQTRNDLFIFGLFHAQLPVRFAIVPDTRLTRTQPK